MWAVRSGGAQRSQPQVEPALTAGDQAPPFVIETVEGDSLQALAGGKNTFVVFFSTSCSFCRASLPVYRDIVRNRCDMTVSFVVLDQKGSELADWWETHAWNEEEACADVRIGSRTFSAEPYGVTRTPTHFWISSEREILEARPGALMSTPEWLEADDG